MYTNINSYTYLYTHLFIYILSQTFSGSRWVRFRVDSDILVFIVLGEGCSRLACAKWSVAFVSIVKLNGFRASCLQDLPAPTGWPGFLCLLGILLGDGCSRLTCAKWSVARVPTVKLNAFETLWWHDLLGLQISWKYGLSDAIAFPLSKTMNFDDLGSIVHSVRIKRRVCPEIPNILEMWAVKFNSISFFESNEFQRFWLDRAGVHIQIQNGGAQRIQISWKYGLPNSIAVPLSKPMHFYDLVSTVAHSELKGGVPWDPIELTPVIVQVVSKGMLGVSC